MDGDSAERREPDPTTAEGWTAQIARIGEELGDHTPLGPRHQALFVDDRPLLLVSFETVETVRALPDRMPPGYALARRHGWSFLGMMSTGETWFRDPAVWGYFDRLVDDAFFEDFDRVVFHGAGPGGYAAMAFSVAAPGATVLALRPQATLDPRLAEWDQRFRPARRLDFTSRYGFAPDMLEGADMAMLLYDPGRAQDAMHAALCARPHVLRLRCRHAGARLEEDLARMGVLDRLLERAMEGQLDAAGFHRLYRARRDHLPYLLRLIARLSARGRPGPAERVARWALARHDHPRLHAVLADVEARQTAAP